MELCFSEEEEECLGSDVGLAEATLLSLDVSESSEFSFFEEEPLAGKLVGKEPVGKEPVGKEPIGKEPVGKDPLGKLVGNWENHPVGILVGNANSLGNVALESSC